MHQAGLAGKQAEASFGAVGKWNGGEKQRTRNRNSAARPMARADLGLSVGIVI